MLPAFRPFGLIASGSRAGLPRVHRPRGIDLDAENRRCAGRRRHRDRGRPLHFVNHGATPVDIRQIESSCGCTTTELAQRHYEPGQSGDIVAHYAVAGHMGAQKKTLAVWSSDHPDAATTLTLVVHIPEIARLQPAFVTWAHDEANKPKIITLEMLQDIPPKTSRCNHRTRGSPPNCSPSSKTAPTNSS